MLRSREALLIAAVRRLAELDLDLGGIATAPPKTVNDLARLLAVLVLEDLGSRFTRAAAAMLAQFGSASPALDARAVIAVCAGLEYESIVGGQRPFTLAEIQAVLADVLHARLDDQS
jgi:hypothetical protein